VVWQVEARRKGDMNIAFTKQSFAIRKGVCTIEQIWHCRCPIVGRSSYPTVNA
jgi:hypothetical protein